MYLLILLSLCAASAHGFNSVEAEAILKRLSEAEHQIALLKEKDNVQQKEINNLQAIVSQHGEANNNLRELVDQQAKTITELEQNNSQLAAAIANVLKTVDELNASPSNNESNNHNQVKIPLDRKEITNSDKTARKEIGKRITKRLPEQPIAFFARKTVTQSNIGVDQHIIFDNVPINKGSGFHPQQGLFIAPQSGLYLISCSLLSLHTSHLPVHANIVHNGKVVARIYAHADVGAVNYDQGSNTVLVEAQQGDEIWLQNYASISEVNGGFYSTFSGYLIWPY